MTRLRAPLAAIMLLCGALGCSGPISFTDPGWDCCGMGGGSNYDPLSLSHIDNMLNGDTVRVRTSSSTSSPRSTWEITGPAVFVIGPDTAATRIIVPVVEVLIRATGSGVVGLRAVRADQGAIVGFSFHVADPSEVTLRFAAGKSLQIPVGIGKHWIEAPLFDLKGLRYRGPVIWTSTDTTAVALEDAPSPFAKFALGRAVGVANIVVAFQHHRDTARVEVVP